MNVNAVVGLSCPEFPVERYANELSQNNESPILSSRLTVISENLDLLKEHYDASAFTDLSLDFALDALSTVLTLSISVLRYKNVDRPLVVDNVIYMLRYIALHYPADEFPEFCSSVPRETKNSSVPRETKKEG